MNHITRKLWRLVQVTINLPNYIKRSGGFLQAIRKTFIVLKWEGFKGIAARLTVPNHSNNYQKWIMFYDTLSDDARISMRQKIVLMLHKPLISVVMPTYNSKPEWLIEAIESVRNQIYPNWELCIADDASTVKAIKPILEHYVQIDSRIKVVYRKQNGHISAASNSALELATGEWVALLDHDDLLSEHALYWVADAINQNSDLKLIYSDEDKIDENGNRQFPYFKCDWNQDLFYSQNLVCHLGVYKANILRDIGGFRIGFEGAQDYDLALRFVEKIEDSNIHHIPRVLYHWRIHDKSTAYSSDVKPYAMQAGEKALNEHLLRKGVSAVAKLEKYGFRVQYSLPEVLPMVSLIIPTKNGFDLIKQCVESIINKTTYNNYEIIIVDNGSDEATTLEYFELLKSEPRIKILRDDRPFNYSALNNEAIKHANGELVGLINNDIEVITPDWLTEMVSHAIRPEVGAVGAKLWYTDDTLQHGGVILVGGVAGHAHKRITKYDPGYFNRANLIQSFCAVTAACLIVKKSLYEEVGGLNDTDLKVAFNDVDFCLKLHVKGYKNIWTPYAELYHHESATRGFEDTEEKMKRFQGEIDYMKKTWQSLLSNDPAYNLNLADREEFSLAWPPRLNHQA